MVKWENGGSGLNENNNGLIRQYFQKGTSLKNISMSKQGKVMNELKHRPRKSLGFFTPYEVYYYKLFVALQT
jgi:transposase, IS30 family